ncbi:DUF166 domain-containing protein [bacterium]|nr:DUF166 domain-containing protein [bacterium]
MDIKKIKNKYKQLKYQHLKKIYHKNLNKLPCNCKYNKQINLPNGSKLNICSFDFEDNIDVDLCYKPEHAKNCNAFCAIKNKEELYKDFIDDLKEEHIRATKYKDINTLYWLHPDLTFDEFPEKDRWYKRFSYWLSTFF